MHKPLLGLSAVLGLLLVGCGGGGGDDSGSGGLGDSGSIIQGTWTGIGEDTFNLGSTFRLDVTAGGSGDITEILVDDTNLGLTAEVASVQSLQGGFLFNYLAEDGALIAAWVPESDTHMAILNDEGTVGALQKNTSSLPALSLTEFQGTDWTGTQFFLDFDFTLLGSVTGMSLAFAPSDNPPTFVSSFTSSEFGTCTAEGVLDAVTDTRGAFSGTFVNTNGNSNCLQSGTVRGYITADRQFAAIVACPAFTATFIPDGCGYLTVSRN